MTDTRYCFSCSKYRPSAGFSKPPGCTREVCARCDPTKVVTKFARGHVTQANVKRSQTHAKARRRAAMSLDAYVESIMKGLK